jgi:translation initiation factor IF-3
MKSYPKQHKAVETRYFVNFQIRAAHVLCIDHVGVNRGVIPIREALGLATASGLDLVQIGFAQNGNPPTCKILDYSKFKYEQSKKDRLSKKKQRESLTEIKEIKFRPSTAENDLRIKAKQAQKFLDDGDKVKITVMFHGRELAHKDIAYNTLRTFLSFVSGRLISEPSLNGRDLVVMLEGATIKTANIA